MERQMWGKQIFAGPRRKDGIQVKFDLKALLHFPHHTWPLFFADIFVIALFMESEMAPHSCILAWKIPWTEEPGGLQSMGSQRAGHS